MDTPRAELLDDSWDLMEMAFASAVLFEQYDEQELTQQANDEAFENLYPLIA